MFLFKSTSVSTAIYIEPLEIRFMQILTVVGFCMIHFLKNVEFISSLLPSQ